MFPVTRELVEYVPPEERRRLKPVIAVEEEGLSPRFPTMDVVPVVVIPD